MGKLPRRSILMGLSALPLAGMAGMVHAADPPVLLRDLYNKDLSFSPLAEDKKGQRIAVEGFMAPPLRADSNFFVLTRRPMATCPFCSSAADWPSDIIAIYTKRVVEVIGFNIPIVVSGVLELGTYKDPEFGFVSRVRLSDASYERK